MGSAKLAPTGRRDQGGGLCKACPRGKRDQGVGLYKTRRPTARPGGEAAYRPAGACGRLPWLASIAAAPLFKTLRLRLKLRKLFVKSLTKNFYLSPPLLRQAMGSQTRIWVSPRLPQA